MTRPHIGFIADALVRDDGSLFAGGAEIYLLELVRTARSLGSEVSVYQRSQRPGQWDVDGVRVVGEPVPYRRLGGLLAQRALSDGCSHLHFNYVERMPPSVRSPVTGTCHAMYWDIPYVDRYRTWYPGRQLASKALPLWRRHHRTRMLGGISRADAVLATDTTVLRIVQSECPELRERITVVPNFCDLGSPAESGAPPRPGMERFAAGVDGAQERGRAVILVPRNLSFVRGGAWIADILAVIDRLEVPCEFMFTGMPVDLYRSGERYERLLEQSLNKLPPRARDRLHIVGGIPHDSMADAYGAADLVLIPTFAHEGSPLAAVEAVSCGVPVVCTNIGGLNDVIRDELTGLVVTPTPEAIGAAVARLVADPALRARMSEAGREEAAVRFTLEAWSEKIIAFGKAAGWTKG